jgi:hypothetical protein
LNIKKQRKYFQAGIILLSLALSVAVPCTAKPAKWRGHVIADAFPEPKVERQLFYLQRDPNTNTIVYGLNIKNNQLDRDNPVHPFWIKYAEGGKREELNFIQRTFAFGISCKQTGLESYDLRIAAYKKYTLHLLKDTSGEYHTYGNINNRVAIIQRIFVRINGGPLFFPNVVYIELKGVDAITGEQLIQRFKP